MTSRDFCFWLQGLFELTGCDANKANDQLSIQQVDCIKRHLAMVFKHDFDPQMGPTEVQQALNNLHQGEVDGPLIRC